MYEDKLVGFLQIVKQWRRVARKGTQECGEHESGSILCES